MAPHRLLVAIGAVCALLVSGGPAAAQPVGESTTHFRWTAPLDFTGTFASMLRFDWAGGENDCSLSTAMSFAHSESAAEPMLNWLEWRTGGSDEWHGMTLAGGSLAQAHTGDLLDTQSLVTAPDGSVAAFYTSEGPFDDFLDMTLAGFNIEMDSRHPLDAPVVIDFACATPFEVSSIAGSLEGRSFTDDSLRGGSGASLVIPVSVQVNDGDGLHHTFESSSVVMSFLDDVFLGTSEGRLTLEYPGGTQSWASASHTSPSLSAGLTGGPGSYDLTLDLVRVGVQSGLSGVLLGVEPLQSLDDLVP